MTLGKLLPYSGPQILTSKMDIIHKGIMTIKCNKVLLIIPGTWEVFNTC